MLALAGVAVAAHAFQFAVISDGSYSSNTGISNEQVVGQTGIEELDTLVLDYATETGEYTGPGGNLDFTFTWGPPGQGYPYGDGNYYQGVWTYANTSTGDFANMNGGGTFAFGINNGDGNGNYHSNTALVGSLVTVPEPAAFAALGIGLVALVRRRRK